MFRINKTNKIHKACPHADTLKKIREELLFCNEFLQDPSIKEISKLTYASISVGKLATVIKEFLPMEGDCVELTVASRMAQHNSRYNVIPSIEQKEYDKEMRVEIKEYIKGQEDNKSGEKKV